MSEFRIAVLCGLLLGLALSMPYGAAMGAAFGDTMRRVVGGHRRLALGLVVMFSLLLLSGCGSVAQLQVGTVKSHPSEKTLRDHICANNPEAARLYLALPEYQWLGAGTLESYRMDAMEYKRLGKCKCPQNAPCAVPSPSDGFVELPKREN